MQPAHVQQVETSVVGVVGWSPDERTFAWRGELAVTRDLEEYAEDAGRAVLGHTLSTAGEQRSWVVQVEGDVGELPQPLDPTGFAAVEQVAGWHRAAPEGLSAYYQGVPVPMDGRWLFAEPPDEDGPDREPDPRIPLGDDASYAGAAVVTWSRCAKRDRIALEFRGWTWVPYSGDPVPGWIRGFPSPSGRWIAVVAAANPYWHMRSGYSAARGGVALVPAGFETQVLRKAAQAEVAERLKTELSPDWVVVEVADALGARDRSVVYAAAGREEEAALLASRIPGGASVEPLTWDVPQACLVVALGASAGER